MFKMSNFCLTIIKILICFNVFIIVNGCTFIFSKLFGVTELHSLDKERCEKKLSSIDLKGIKYTSVYTDSLAFLKFSSLPPTLSGKKLFSQPI